MVVIDKGRVIAQGTADQLKAEVGGERIEIVVDDAADLAPARELLAEWRRGTWSSRSTCAGSPLR